MTSPLRFDLLLLGYRNDLARERVLRFLRDQSSGLSGPRSIERDADLPQLLYADLDHQLGLRLLAPLRERGAQVRLVAREKPAIAASQPAAPARRSRPVLVFVALTAAVALLALRPWWPVISAPAVVHDWVSLVLRAPDAAPLAEHFASDLSKERNLLRQWNEEALALHASGDFDSAARLLRSALDERHGHPTLLKNLRTVLRNSAVNALNADRPRDAIEALREALSFGEDASLLGLLGVAHARAGDETTALPILERAVELGSDEPAVLVALGNVYRQLGNRQGAVETLQRAREMGADGTDLHAILYKLERELDAEWDFAELSSAHFRISFDGGENDEIAALVLAELEDVYFTVGRKLGYYPAETTEIVLYSSEEFHDITKTPRWTGGIYDGRIKLPIRGLEHNDPLLGRTLRHEFAHVLVTKLSGGRVPVWLSEGIAIWAEEDTDGERAAWARQTLSGRYFPRLNDLEGPFTRLPPEQVSVAYAQSYLAVRALLDGFGAARVRALLVALGDGRTLESAFTAVLGISARGFETDLIRSLTG